jgi:hypothetical protein
MRFKREIYYICGPLSRQLKQASVYLLHREKEE